MADETTSQAFPTVRTDNELKQIAKDIYEGRIFTDRSITENDRAGMLTSVFMPIAFMTDDQMNDLMAQKPAVFFEYLDKAGPRSINGYPIFMSLQIITEPELITLYGYLQRLRDAPDPLADRTTVADPGPRAAETE